MIRCPPLFQQRNWLKVFVANHPVKTAQNVANLSVSSTWKITFYPMMTISGSRLLSTDTIILSLWILHKAFIVLPLTCMDHGIPFMCKRLLVVDLLEYFVNQNTAGSQWMLQKEEATWLLNVHIHYPYNLAHQECHVNWILLYWLRCVMLAWYLKPLQQLCGHMLLQPLTLSWCIFPIQFWLQKDIYISHYLQENSDIGPYFKEHWSLLTLYRSVCFVNVAIWNYPAFTNMQLGGICSKTGLLCSLQIWTWRVTSPKLMQHTWKWQALFKKKRCLHHKVVLFQTSIRHKGWIWAKLCYM